MLLPRLLRWRRSRVVRDMSAEEYAESRALTRSLRACDSPRGGEPLRVLCLDKGWLYRPVCLPITRDCCTHLELHQIYADRRYQHIYTEAFARTLNKAPAAAIDNGFLLATGQNYWHLLMDFLPRLYLIAVMPDLRDRALIVDAAMPERERALVAQLAARVGMPEPHLVPLTRDVHRFENTCCPGRIDRVSAAAIWDEVLYPLHTRPNRGIERLFVMRETRRRRLVNQAELAAKLQQLGFTCIEPGALPFDEQVATFAGARVIVGVHGAALANLLFAPAGATVVELYTTVEQPFYRDLARAKGLRYIALGGEAVGTPTDHHDDFTVNPEALSVCLKMGGID
jgi:capsular polysaccharide biosynthesis protein